MGRVLLFTFVLSLTPARAQPPIERPCVQGPVRLSIATAGDYQFSSDDSLDYTKHPNASPPTCVLITTDRPDTLILHLVDSEGNSVAESGPTFLKPGRYQVNFKDNHLSSGVYFFRFKASDTTWSKRLIFMMAE